MKILKQLGMYIGVLALLAAPFAAQAQLSSTNPVDFHVRGVMDEVKGREYKIVVDEVFAQDYASFTVTFPRELNIKYEALDARWMCTTVPGSATFIARNNATYSAAQLKTDIAEIYFTFVNAAKPPPEGSKIGINASSDRVAAYVGEDNKIYFYEYYSAAEAGIASGKFLTWQEAYNFAKTRTKSVTVGGRTVTMQGYLATITSQEEQYMLFNTIADKAGWVGGTRAWRADGTLRRMQDESLVNVNNGQYNISYSLPSPLATGAFGGTAKDWYWACGPEAFTKPNPAYDPIEHASTNPKYDPNSPLYDPNHPRVKPYIYTSSTDAQATPLVFYKNPIVYLNAGTAVSGAIDGVYNAFDNHFNNDIHGSPGVTINSSAGSGNNPPYAPNNAATSGAAVASSNPFNSQQVFLRFAWLRDGTTSRIDLWDDFENDGKKATDLEGLYVKYGGYTDDPTVYDISGGSSSAIEEFIPHTTYVQYRMPVKNAQGEFEMIPSIGTSADNHHDGYTGETYTFQPLPNVPAGYVFSGYTVYAIDPDKAEIQVNEDKSLTGRVSPQVQTIVYFYYPQPITVTFDVNAPITDLTAFVSPDSKTVTMDALYNHLPIPRRQGYEFAGWFLDKACTEGPVTEETIVATSENHTLYAKWTVQGGYRVVYDLNSPDSPVTPESIPDKDEGVTWLSTDLLPDGDKPTRADDYKFVAWTAVQNGARRVVTPETAYSDIALSTTDMYVTLTAQWAKYYKVYYNVNGANWPVAIHELDILEHEEDVTHDERFIVAVMPSETPVRAGYIFQGWRVADRGNGTAGSGLVGAEDVFMDLAFNDGVRYIALEAVWLIDEVPRTVSYYYNYDGSSTELFDQRSDVFPLTYQLTPAPAGTPTRDGYAFLGWNTAADGTGQNVTAADRYMNLTSASTLALFARWQPVTYVVHYDMNGSPDAPLSSRVVTLDESPLIPSIMQGDKLVIDPPTAPVGYTFQSWDVIQNGFQVNVQPTDTYRDLALDVNAGSIMIKAVWEPKRPYEVRFNMNAGTDTTNPLSVPTVYGLSWISDVMVPDGSGYIRTNYRFIGWNTKADGSGRVVQSGDTYGELALLIGQGDGPAYITLYAQWVNNALYTVVFDMADSTNYPVRANQSGATGFSINLSMSPAPVKTGYTFGGWRNITEGGTGGSTEPIDPSTNSIAYSALAPNTIYVVTLQAVWTPKSFTVHYHDNHDDSPAVDSVTVNWTTADLDHVVPISYLRAHIFAGWNTESNGTGYTVKETDTYGYLATVAGQGDTENSITLYAQWTPSPYTVYYNLGYAGATNPSPQTVAPTDAELLPTQPTHAGYTFLQWDVTENGMKENVTDEDAFADLAFPGTGYITLTARWVENIVTSVVKFDVNGGTGGQTANVTATFGSIMPAIVSTPPTREGFTFDGYYDTPESTGGKQYYTASMTGADAWDKDDTETWLYARWISDTYTVAFDANGGTGTMTSLTCTFGQTYELVSAAFTYEGYVFEGWSRTSGGEVEFIDCASITDLVEIGTLSVTLYAVWSEKPAPPVVRAYTVHFHLAIPAGVKGEYTTPTDMACMTNETFHLPQADNIPGYTFGGWKKSDGTSYTNLSQPVVNLVDPAGEETEITVYAIWNQ